MSVKAGVKALARGIAEVGILKDMDSPTRVMPRFGVSSCAESCHHALLVRACQPRWLYVVVGDGDQGLVVAFARRVGKGKGGGGVLVLCRAISCDPAWLKSSISG